MAAKAKVPDLKVRYHYWEYNTYWTTVEFKDNKLNVDDLEPMFHRTRFDKKTRELVYEKVKPNIFTAKLLEYIAKKFYWKDSYRVLTIAEDRDTGAFGIAVQHPIDSDNNVFNKKLGRTIALGRLKKRLGMKTK